MAKARVSTVITDLDNTLFDWVDMWYRSFKALLDSLVEQSGLGRDTLEREFKAIHQRHGTSEYAFAIQELPSLLELYPGEDLQTKFDDAIHRYSSARKYALQLYPSVLDTLRTLKTKGCVVVGYTESMAFYSNRRVKQLGLDGLLDYLYSPEDHDIPEGVTRDDLRHYPPDEYRLIHTEHRHTPKGVLKPSPEVLIDIASEVGAKTSETLYVGDNLLKDVSMAQIAKIMDVFAKYGEAKDRPEQYDLLRRVTHWSQEMVQKERQLKVEDIRPSFTLKKDFGEILDLFEFGPPRRTPQDAHLDQALDAWRKTVDVQQHFNDLELRIRSLAITLLLATLGAAGVVMKEGMRLSFGGLSAALPCVLLGAAAWLLFHLAEWKVARWVALVGGILLGGYGHWKGWAVPLGSPPLASFVLLAGLLGWGACYFMDRWWYHRLLYGAVHHGLYIEERLRDALPETSLTEAIGNASPFRLGAHFVRSNEKIDWFYGVVALLLCLGAIILWNATPGAEPAAAKAPTASLPSPNVP
jgi:FMN phosphatase YigB (HAD superfamily)